MRGRRGCNAQRACGKLEGSGRARRAVRESQKARRFGGPRIGGPVKPGQVWRECRPHTGVREGGPGVARVRGGSTGTVLRGTCRDGTTGITL